MRSRGKRIVSMPGFTLRGCERVPSDALHGAGASGACWSLILLIALAACTCASPPAATETRLVSPLPTATSAPSPQPSVTAPAAPSPTVLAAIPLYAYRVVRSYPHDPASYTEGLVLVDGALYESTGLVGRSSLRRVDLETGMSLQTRLLPEPYFGEGIAVLDGEIFQLTWKSRVGFVYDRETFDLERSFSYATEGWGLTTDGERLIMSDGTAALRFLDPETLRQVSVVQVEDDQGPVTKLNELEYVDGEIWANVWLTDRIVRIDPATGRVTGNIDLTGLLDRSTLVHEVDVLNGIAYDAGMGRLLVTGKLWPWLFEIEVVPSGVE